MLRADPRFAHVTVRDIYQHRVIGRIAAALEAAPSGGQAREARLDAAARMAALALRARAGGRHSGLVAVRMVQWLAPFFTYHFFTGAPEDSIPYAVAMSVLVFLLATVLEFAVAIVGKWLIAGRLRRGAIRCGGSSTSAGGWPTG